MRQILLSMIVGVVVAGLSNPARAETGWIRLIQTHDAAHKANLPSVNLPKPDWAQVLDIQNSDGTTFVPSCSDPDVIATVRDGIISAVNSQYDASGGNGEFVKKAEIFPVWVHPAYSGGYVCDTHVQLDIAFTGADEWKFQTFAKDGKAYVFFYNSSSQN